jgi:RNA polymerase sigma-70 factor (sigma-E family)
MSPREDDAEFEAFVAARYRRLLQVAYLLTCDVGRAEDLLQTALLKTWSSWRRLRPEAAEAYVRTVLVRTSASWWRRRWRGELPTASVPERAAADDLARVLDREALLRPLGRLPARMRAVIVLRYFEDLSERQAAAALGCSVGSVKSLSSKALARLRELPSLADEGPARRSV